jgi:signal-induced proliferation-associated 1 like protein 3
VLPVVPVPVVPVPVLPAPVVPVPVLPELSEPPDPPVVVGLLSLSLGFAVS